jgi:nanoRNase/pAp phosphatase (c-di-AMP/oligoRNAs hydrolase)
MVRYKYTAARSLTSTRTRRSDRFLELLAGQRVIIVTHDNPDPDAIASGWALLVLLRKVLDQPARLVGRGAIVRAENLHLMRVLSPPLELVDELPEDEAAIVLVDCVPTANNQPLNGSRVRVVAVLDHHQPDGERFRVAHRDIRPRCAATATIAASYLREQGVEPAPELATALLFAIRTELTGVQTSVTRADRGTLAWLSGRADYGQLAEIEDAPLSRAYFSDLLLALESVFIYDDAAICFLPQTSGAQIVGEVADLVIRCAGVRRVLCGAPIENDLVLSARTKADGGNVVALLGDTLRGVGHWGGHEHRAGGKLPGLDRDGRTPETLYALLKERWLSACKVDQQRGTRLVRRQAILEHL